MNRDEGSLGPSRDGWTSHQVVITTHWFSVSRKVQLGSAVRDTHSSCKGRFHLLPGLKVTCTKQKLRSIQCLLTDGDSDSLSLWLYGLLAGTEGMIGQRACESENTLAENIR